MSLAPALSAAGLALTMLLAASATSAAGARLELLREPAAAGEPFDLRVQDQWPNACAPELSAVEVDGDEIWVIALDTAERRDCAPGARSYQLETRLSPQGFAVLAQTGVQRVHYVVQTQTGMRLRGFALIPMAMPAEASPQPESGYWWADPKSAQEFAGPGIGINLERQGQTLSAVVFGYDQEGRPEWTLASGPLGAHSSQMSLSRLHQGSGPRGRYQRPQAVDALGSVWLKAQGPGRASAWLVYLETETADLSLHRLELVRFSFSNSVANSWQGRWLVLLPGLDQARPQAREIELTELRGESGGFVLASADGGAELLCVYDETDVEGLPRHCQLTLTDVAAPLEFDRLGLRQLQSSRAEGVRLISLDDN
jgi:hypothetical protein